MGVECIEMQHQLLVKVIFFYELLNGECWLLPFSTPESVNDQSQESIIITQKRSEVSVQRFLFQWAVWFVDVCSNSQWLLGEFISVLSAATKQIMAQKLQNYYISSGNHYTSGILLQNLSHFSFLLLLSKVKWAN